MMGLDKYKIDILMAKKQFNRKDLLKEAGISDFTYYKCFERGTSPKNVGKIAKALGVDVEEIIVKEE